MPRARTAARAAAVLVMLALLVVVPHRAGASLEARIARCLACHGERGQSAVPETPSLGGQPVFFIVAQLFLFREGRRSNAVMTEAAKDLTNDDLRALATSITALPPPDPPREPAEPLRAARGAALARQHHCVVCHNADFSGREQVPRLANQREDYLIKVMREYRSGARIGYGGTMVQELRPLTDPELQDLAHFLARLPRP